MDLFYVTILVFATHLSPPSSWIQFTKPFETVDQCEQFLVDNWAEVEESFRNQIGLTAMEIKTTQCMTQTDVHERNSMLGHRGF